MPRHADDRPHPLRHTATWVGIFGGIAVVGANVGVEQLANLPTQVEPIITALGSGGILYASTQVTARQGEKKVTPVDDPRDNDGNQLVPVTRTDIESYSI